MSTSNSGQRYQGFDDTPVVLRRRAKQLDAEGYSATFCSVLQRAADELIVRRRCASDPEREAIDQLGNVNVLRRCLQNIAGLVAQSTMAKELRQEVAKNLNIAHLVKRPGKETTVLSIEVIKGEPFERFIERVTEQYDIHTGGATHGEESTEETEEPEGPGRDTDQHQRAEGEDREADEGSALQPRSPE